MNPNVGENSRNGTILSNKGESKQILAWGFGPKMPEKCMSPQRCGSGEKVKKVSNKLLQIYLRNKSKSPNTSQKRLFLGQSMESVSKQNNEKHIFAIESDSGGFTPKGFGVVGDNAQVAAIQRFKPLFVPYGLHEIERGGGGADIGPLGPQGTVLIGFKPDSQRYFEYHHAANDVFEAVNQRELELGAASMAALVYLLDKYGR